MAQGAEQAVSENWKSELMWAFRSTRVVTPEGLRAGAILVRAGRIVEVAAWEDVPADAHLRDYGDHVLLPGLVDTHVHLNEPGRTEWEGFKTGTQAAAAGGVTTVVDMPLNCIPETISVAALNAKRAAIAGGETETTVSEFPAETEAEAQGEASENRAWVDWMAWGGVVGNGGAGGNEAELAGLIEAGVPGFKCFLVDSGIDGFAWVDEAQLRKAVAILTGSGLPLLAHAELPGPVERATAALHASGADWRSYSTYLASRPDSAELEAIELVIALATAFDTPLHIVHLATAEALPMLKKARESGLKITVETCPQYLWFAAEDIPDGATEYKCAPPIRDTANREALWQALHDGHIDMIATDHSPCPPEMKQRESGRFDQAWGGVASLGLALPVIWTGLVQRSNGSVADLAKLTQWMAAEPARLAGLIGQKGALAAGYDADIVVFEPDAEWTVTEDYLRFRHKLSPYLGAKLRGRVLETYLRGECIFWGRGSAGVLDPTAHGKELRRSGSSRQALAEVNPTGSLRAAHALTECRLLATMSEEPGRITRRFLTPPVAEVHAHLKSRMESIGMTVATDAAGNLRGLWRPAKEKGRRLILGSHIDSVPDAGAYDGVLGVVLAIEWVRIAQSIDFPRSIEVIAFSEEEGVRYGVPFLGSRAVTGTFDPALLACEDADGVRMEDAIRTFGFDPGKIGEAALDNNVLAFVEVHIEQGPVLESEGLSLAVVEGIAGQTRLGFRFTGHANHAGTTPMHLRRDALAAAAEWMVAVEALAKDTEGLVATVGKIAAQPNAGNVVPGVVDVSLDVRHFHNRVRLGAVRQATALARKIAARRGLAVEWVEKIAERTVHMDAIFSAHLKGALEDAGFPIKTMPSGAGHDAMVMAKRLPTVMLFLRSLGGISHHPDESVLEEDVESSLKVAEAFLKRLL